MYRLTETEIDFIWDDIRARGVTMEGLQDSLLDHICCYVEEHLDEGSDFYQYYPKAISKFFISDLCEIENETILLLTFKNYYKMKKALIISGTMSAAGFIIGSLFKLMFWPGAGALLIASILLVSLVFLPLLCIINVREKPAVRDRLIMVSGTMTGSLYCLSMLSLLQRWPIKHEIWMITLGVCFFLFIPLYFFTGIRNHATRMNTIISTVLLVAATGVQFTMTALRPERTTVVKQAALTASASKFVSQP